MARVTRKSRVSTNIAVTAKGSNTATGTTGETLTPDPINRELAALAGEINGGIDRDNFRVGVITAAKFENHTFHKIHRLEESNARNVDVYSGASKTRLYDVPYGSSGNLEFNIYTGDVALEIEASVGFVVGGTGASPVGKHYEPAATVASSGDNGLPIEAGGSGRGDSDGEAYFGEMYAWQPVVLVIVVDGKVVARSAMQADLRQQCRNIMAYVPVGAGAHKIQVKAMMYPGRDIAQDAGGLGYLRVAFTDKSFWCREVIR